MRIIVDVDGVQADLIRPVLAWVNDRYGTAFTRGDIRQWDQPLAGTGTDVGTVIAWLLLDHPFVMRIPAVEGVRKGMRWLGYHHTVDVATSRPAVVAVHTQKWLQRRGLRYRDFYCTDDKASLEGEVLIDDNLNNCMRFAMMRGVAILFDQPWNRQPIDRMGLHIVRARGWRGVVHLLEWMGGRRGAWPK